MDLDLDLGGARMALLCFFFLLLFFLFFSPLMLLLTVLEAVACFWWVGGLGVGFERGVAVSFSTE